MPPNPNQVPFEGRLTAISVAPPTVTVYLQLNDRLKALNYAERWAASEPESATAQQVLQDLRYRIHQPAHEARAVSFGDPQERQYGGWSVGRARRPCGFDPERIHADER